MIAEKTRLKRVKMTSRGLLRMISFLEQGWCKDHEARDAAGSCVNFNDPKAVQWDICGASAKAFGIPNSRWLAAQIYGIAKGTRVIPLLDNGFRYLCDYNDSELFCIKDVVARLRAHADSMKGKK